MTSLTPLLPRVLRAGFVLLLACSGPRGTTDPIAVDRAQFAAVVDTVRTFLGGEVLGASPVPFEMDSAMVSGSDSLRRELSKRVLARRAVLEEKGITILESIEPGECPPIFTDENSAAFCPAKEERRFAVGLASRMQESSDVESSVRIIVGVTALNRGGSITYSAACVLDLVKGRWKVIRVEIALIT